MFIKCTEGSRTWDPQLARTATEALGSLQRCKVGAQGSAPRGISIFSVPAVCTCRESTGQEGGPSCPEAMVSSPTGASDLVEAYVGPWEAVWLAPGIHSHLCAPETQGNPVPTQRGSLRPTTASTWELAGSTESQPPLPPPHPVSSEPAS